MSAAELSVGDRQHGRVGMDQLLCRHFASENRDCALRRESSDFVMASAYRIDAELVDLKALDRVGDHYVRAQVHHMTDEWEAFARYRRSGQLSDLYLGSPETASYDVTLTGATVESPALHAALVLVRPGPGRRTHGRRLPLSLQVGEESRLVQPRRNHVGLIRQGGRAGPRLRGAAAHGRETAAGLTRAGASCRRAGQARRIQCTTPQTMRAPPPPSGAGVSL